MDVRNFAAIDRSFPHDSTSQQFVDEDRFESYRALGYHSIMALAGRMASGDAWDLCAEVARTGRNAEPFAHARASHV